MVITWEHLEMSVDLDVELSHWRKEGMSGRGAWRARRLLIFRIRGVWKRNKGAGMMIRLHEIDDNIGCWVDWLIGN